MIDLDSICSAVVYSYIASISPQHRKPAVFHIPLLNIPRADIALRPELLAALPYANIGKEHLITLDDLGDESTWERRIPPADTRWILVDHNTLQGKLGQLYGKSVVGTIDHHVDEGSVPHDMENEPRIIGTSGSCASLVVNHFAPTWDSWFLYVSFSGAANGQGDNLIEDGAFATLWDAQVAHLALAAALIDTTDLEDANKTTQHDRQAVGYLEAKIKLSQKMGKTYNRRAFFELVAGAKQDLDGLSVRDVLRKDYKQWTEGRLLLGTSSVVQPLSYLEAKARKEGNGDEDLAELSARFAAEREMDVLAIITGYTTEGGAFHREVSLLSHSESGKRVILQFEKAAGPQLQLQEQVRTEERGRFRVAWQQGNLAASRKQVAPMLREAMLTVQG